MKFTKYSVNSFDYVGFLIRTGDNLSVEKTRVILPLPVLFNHPNIIENFSDNYMYLKKRGLRINVFYLITD